jgi:hypothetical protein
MLLLLFSISLGEEEGGEEKERETEREREREKEGNRNRKREKVSGRIFSTWSRICAVNPLKTYHSPVESKRKEREASVRKSVKTHLFFSEAAAAAVGLEGLWGGDINPRCIGCSDASPFEPHTNLILRYFRRQDPGFG